MEKSVGRFVIRRELGRGAQSVVYLAWDPQLEREVAIKTLHFARTDARRNDALLAEARAVSRLAHPNLVPIFDVGEEDGDPYLVFEFVDGPILRS
jgi:serine/threonine protein kinase